MATLQGADIEHEKEGVPLSDHSFFGVKSRVPFGRTFSLFGISAQAAARLLLSSVLMILIPFVSSAQSPSSPPLQRTLVTTPSGRLSGFMDTTRKLRAFRGIPYAKPPLGELRWRPPVPFGSWPGVRDAVHFGSPCIQPRDGGWATIEDRSRAAEDCLYLNVVAPAAVEGTAAAASASYPVVVYLHAGEFHYGAGSDRESDWPFADDVVLVTPNSRLGPFGFLGSDALRPRSADGSTGSYGLSDQRLALRWVRANIAAFGGNASNIILMGESSGGTSVALHLVSPESWGLFHEEC